MEQQDPDPNGSVKHPDGSATLAGHFAACTYCGYVNNPYYDAEQKKIRISRQPNSAFVHEFCYNGVRIAC